MKKTVGTLCAGDNIFLPLVTEIRQFKVDLVQKTEQGTKIACNDHYDMRLREADYCSEIATKVTYNERKDVYYVRFEDAQKKQKELQTIYLHELQEKAANAIRKLAEFTNKYFTDETIH